MATTVVRTIGTAGRDYSTIQAWEDACPANLVTADQIWQGECYNDAEFVITAGILMSGTTTDATRYLHLTAAAGQSFADHASKETNRLAYNQSVGVGITSTTQYMSGAGLVTVNNYARISRLQFNSNMSGTFNASSACVIAGSGGASGVRLDGCIFRARLGYPIQNQNGTSVAWISTNCLLITENYGYYFNDPSPNDELHNCTIVSPGSVSTNAAIRLLYSATPVLKNCAVYGFNGVLTASSLNSASNHNSTEDSAPTNWGANSQNGQTYANQFVDITNNTSNMDFRVKGGANLIGAGSRDQTYTNDLDICGRARSTSTPTIGCWEVAGLPTLAADSGTYNITGQPAGTRIARRLAAGQGTYNITGQDAGLSKSSARTLAMGQGTYAITGQPATFRRGYAIAMAQGAYAITGSDAAVDVEINMGPGTYAITGFAAGLRAARRMTAGQGTYAITGQNVTLSKSGGGGGNVIMTMQHANYSITGFAAGTTSQRKIAAGQGAYVFTGFPATLSVTRRMAAAAGSYAVTGQDIDLDRGNPKLNAEVGFYAITGMNTRLRYSGRPDGGITYYPVFKRIRRS